MPDNDQNDITRSHLQLTNGGIIGYYCITKRIGAGFSAVLGGMCGRTWGICTYQRISVLRFLVYVFVALSAFTSSKASKASDSSDSSIRDTTRILFLGNSYTYYNNLPEIIAKLAEAGGQATVEYQMVTQGGWRLKDHWEKGEARELLHRDHWDYVVLQEHSTLGIYFILDGQCRVSTDSLFSLYANRWAAEIGERGATPLFFLTWARQWAPSDQAILNYAYITAGKETHSMIAPVGIAWNLLRETGSDIELYVEDGSHPSAAGSYLAGCTFYATIFKQNPISLPAKISGTPFNLETSKLDSGITALLVDLTADQARSIQVSAWTATRMFMPLGEYPEVSPAPTAELAQLPPGEQLNPQLLAGVWSGQIRFFDLTDPVDMKLQFQLRNAAWHIGLELRFNSKDLVNETVDVSDVVIGERNISFTDPKSAGVENLSIRFRAVIDGGEMRGTAEAIEDASDPRMHYLGSWVLVKE